MCKKQQTTEHEDSPDHIILHYAPAALLQAEKNLIHLDAGLSLLGHFWGYLFSIWVVCVNFYFIYKIVSVQYIIQIYAEQHTGAVCESLNERRSRLSYCMIWRVWCFA